jgi:hypothetical protein
MLSRASRQPRADLRSGPGGIHSGRSTVEQASGRNQPIPVGTHRLPVSPAFVKRYNEAVAPLIIAERVWIERRGLALLLHLGRCAVIDDPESNALLEAPQPPPDFDSPDSRSQSASRIGTPVAHSSHIH